MKSLNSFFIIVVFAFFASTSIFHEFAQSKSVFWSIFSHQTKDLFISALVVLYAVRERRSSVVGATVVSLFYFLTLLSVRIYCAVGSSSVYEDYMQLMQSISICYLINTITLALCGIVIITLINERRSSGADQNQ